MQNIVPALLEPYCAIQFLPRCVRCGAKHPLAYAPPSATAACPECGAPSVRLGQSENVPAVLTGRGAGVAEACFRLGRFFSGLSKRLS